MSNRLTTEQLEEIRIRAEKSKTNPFQLGESSQYEPHHCEDVMALIAEIERLRATAETKEQLTQRQILEETQRIRRELDRTRRERDFDWDVGY